jgi:glycosyltransferase involved in cell wall biosynthesis
MDPAPHRRDRRSPTEAVVKLTFVYPTLPPAVNGIGDYTIGMGAELVRRDHEVSILCSRPSPQTREIARAAGIRVVDIWPDGDLRRLDALVDDLRTTNPDAVVVEYEPFSYGRRGFNPRFSGVLARVARATPSVTRVLLVHEAHVEVEDAKTFVMRAYQRPQFLRISRSADCVLMSSDAWTSLLPRRARARADVAPIPSNLPAAAPSARDHADDGVVRVGVFGSLDDRKRPYLAEALRALESAGAELSYIGPHENRWPALLAPVPRLAVSVRGVLPAPEAAAFIATRDLMLAPFAEGITSRRTSVSAALLMGRPVLTTVGAATDALSSRAVADGAMAATAADDPAAYGRATAELVRDAARRRRIGDAGAAYYRDRLDVRHGADAIERAAQWRRRRYSTS